ncbi:hypothetical protein phiPH15_gp26 [Streptococcus phage PH15]|uniref:hypothetical protein n=1 Tax=Streptococcus phage PH15 TaxID=537874 RepID=UPI0001761C0A|nr:hypothetical protein phiPH15_gp26 [Streptococcus phage PH15]CAQ57821.1 hypothetical protein [Streptococcus phage PH15]
MNKKELISIIRTEILLAKSSPERKGYIAGLEEAINIIEGFSNEPQKPVVPQFVADYIEKYKEELSIRELISKSFVSVEVDKWLLEVDEDGAFINQETLVRAILYGYEVEKEKRYLVKMKGMQKDCVALKKNKDGGYWYLSDTYPYGSTINIHTRKELEDAGFGWVFDCPGIEVEEVE